MLHRVAYKVGSYFKGCGQCGDTEMVPWGSRMVKRYLNGYDVYRSYAPSVTGWTYWCMTCGARDLGAWGNAKDIGEFAIRGTREAIAKAKEYRLRQQKLKMGALAKVDVPVPAKDGEVEALEKELARLKELLKSR